MRSTVVILAGLAILTTLFYLLTGGTLLQEKVALYILLPDATGVGPGSSVRVNGIRAGTVEKIELSGSTDPRRIVKITMRVERRKLVTIPVDSQAELNTETLIGDKYIGIASGRSAETIRPNGTVLFREPSAMMSSLDLSQFEASLRAMDTMLTEIEQGTSRVGRFIRGDQVYRDVRRRITEVQEKLHEAVGTTGAIGRELYGEASYRRIRDPIVQLDQALMRLQSGQGTAGRLLRDTADYERIAAGFADMRKSIGRVRTAEFVASDTAYNNWNRAIGELIVRADEFNTGRLMTDASTYENLNGFARELESSIRDFRQNPRKFLRLKVF